MASSKVVFSPPVRKQFQPQIRDGNSGIISLLCRVALKGSRKQQWHIHDLLGLECLGDKAAMSFSADCQASLGTQLAQARWDLCRVAWRPDQIVIH